uniref:CAAX prenyl protease 2 n=1 Tax=Brugia malayi TaxID=6279 RepID=A0A0J9YAB1_BRUMA|nr:BMA-FCE-2 [Brugia malayi]
MSILLYLSLATVISSSYVGLLYAFDFYGVDRDDPHSIKRRLLGAVLNNIISIACTYAVLCKVISINFTFIFFFFSIAPVTEEVAFRACASTLILQCLSSTVTIFVAPLPFALSHLHHIFDDMKKGYTKYEAINRRAFQTSYSYFFGAYATFLFVRTGHILAPIVSHSVCNNMGLPLLPLIDAYPKRSTRILLWFSYLLGFVLWL